MKKLILLSLLFLSFAQAETITQTETIQCKVTEVIDGNNIVCEKDNKKNIKVKLYQIDAPELDQPHGLEAKEFLSRRLLNQNAELEIHNINKFNQNVGTIYLWSMCSCYPIDHPLAYRNASDDCGCKYDHSIEIIRAGYAWYDPFDGKNTEYQQAQEEAKHAKSGLWADPNPIPLWEWRKQHKGR